MGHTWMGERGKFGSKNLSGDSLTGFRISLLAIAPGDTFLWEGCRPPTPLRKVGLRPPWALDPILDGALGPMGPGPRLHLELFRPKMGFWEIEK